jgi:hypothetical protein
VFAPDDPTAKESAAKTVRFFGDDVDYLLVENPAKFKSDEFRRTALSAWLAQRSTPTLRIPAITALTMNAWEALERKLKRYLPLSEACQQKELLELSRYELGFLRDRFLVQFEDYASQVLQFSRISTSLKKIAMLSGVNFIFLFITISNYWGADSGPNGQGLSKLRVSLL